MKFGIDRLLEEPALRKPLAGQARGAARASRVGHARPHAFARCARGARRREARPPPSGRSTACAATSRTTWSSRRTSTIRRSAFPCSASTAKCAGPTPAMMDTFDVLLVDLQDVGCRIYTFVTTLRYVLEAAREAGQGRVDSRSPESRGPSRSKALRLARGLGKLRRRGPAADAPRPHARRARALVRAHAASSTSTTRSSTMEGWQPEAAPGYGWPLGERTWVNPSPNAANLSMARAYAGTVMIEGTTLSEGRGTTRPLELLRRAGHRCARAADRDARARAALAGGLPPAPLLVRADVPQARRQALRGLPDPRRRSRATTTTAFRPWRLVALALKALRRLQPDYGIWRDFDYEYERGKLAIDVINGSELLREWVDDPAATPADLDALAVPTRKPGRTSAGPFCSMTDCPRNPSPAALERAQRRGTTAVS